MLGMVKPPAANPIVVDSPMVLVSRVQMSTLPVILWLSGAASRLLRPASDALSVGARRLP